MLTVSIRKLILSTISTFDVIVTTEYLEIDEILYI